MGCQFLCQEKAGPLTARVQAERGAFLRSVFRASTQGAGTSLPCSTHAGITYRQGMEHPMCRGPNHAMGRAPECGDAGCNRRSRPPGKYQESEAAGRHHVSYQTSVRHPGATDGRPTRNA